ncbi:hypothetical protein [Floridanema aerugineum]|uniref:Uncharacterized protein n=1 Tax=Floridaenema aerugineum BLCC-F46 TaxID=3153654 RepID=A0ABV4X6X9_9CYAN
MKGLLIFMFSLGAFWDFATSFLGIVGIFGLTKIEFTVESTVVFITAVIGSGIILGLGLNTEKLWEKDPDEEFYKWLRPFHVVAIFFDAYTSFLGTAQNIILRNTQTSFITIGIEEVLENTTVQQQLTLLFLTITVTISPIMMAKLSEK